MYCRLPYISRGALPLRTLVLYIFQQRGTMQYIPQLYAINPSYTGASCLYVPSVFIFLNGITQGTQNSIWRAAIGPYLLYALRMVHDIKICLDLWYSNDIPRQVEDLFSLPNTVPTQTQLGM
jgi:hypothetical protein